MQDERFPEQELIVELESSDPYAPRAVLCRAERPGSGGRWIVYTLDRDGNKGNGRYFQEFDAAWTDLRGLVRSN